MARLLLRASVLLSLFCIVADVALGQFHYYDVWMFADRLGLDFRNGSALPTSSAILSMEGCSTICDPATGALLFYTNGSTVWNRNHRVMRNGDDLFGNLSCTQSVLIVPHPGDSLQYYIFTLDGNTYGGPRNPMGLGLNYSIVDLRGDGGLGDVVRRNVSLLSTASEKLTAVRHRNGCEFWVITHELDNDRFYVWYLSKAGLSNTPIVSRAGTSYTQTPEAGYLKASPNGTMLFAARSTLGYNRLWGELLQFDPSTGVVGPILAQLPSGYGASFSPDNNFLYASREDTLLQYDLRLNQAGMIANRKVLNTPDKTRMLYAMQIGPDCKIYVSHGPTLPGFVLSTPHIGVINNPNEEGTNADYQLLPFREFLDPITFYAGLPNCIDGFFGKPEPKRFEICAGDSVQLQGPEGTAWQWSPSEGLSCDNCSNPVASPRTTTAYVVRSSTSGGCPQFDSLIVTILDPPKVDAGKDVLLCPGDSVQLQAAGGISYRWEASPDLSCTDCADPIATPQITTSYVVEATGEHGCTARDTVTVSINRDTAKIIPSDTAICRGERLFLTVSGGTEFFWSPADGLSCTECDSLMLEPQQTTTYIVRATTNGICPTFDSITIVVHDLPLADAGPDTAVCPGESVQLQGKGGTEYRWSSNASLDCFDCENPIAAPLTTTTYHLTVVNEYGCESEDSITVQVLDSTNVEVSPDVAFCPGGSTQLSATGATFYRWTPTEGLSCSDCPNPVAAPKQTTVYYAVGMNSSWRCSTIDSVRVTVYPALTVSAGETKGICLGNATELHAEGGVRWLWEPSEGLNCTYCADPVASPTSTTLYHLTAWSADGCEARDSVEVVVQESPKIIHLQIGRNYRGYPDQRRLIGVEAYDLDGITDIDELEFELEYDAGVALISGSSVEQSLAGTLLEGWSVEVMRSVPGHLVFRVTSPPGKTLSGTTGVEIRELFRFEARLYLSNTRGSELLLRVKSSSNCFSFETDPGYAQVDSLCGLNFRLIELSTNKYVAPVAYPNPARDRVTFEFGIGLDGPTKLEILDVLGKRVALIVDDELQPGRYSVDWNVRDIAAGVYWYRIISGDWSEGRQVRVGR